MTTKIDDANIAFYAAVQVQNKLFDSALAGLAFLFMAHNWMTGLRHAVPLEAFWSASFFFGAALHWLLSRGMDAMADRRRLNSEQLSLVSQGPWHKAGSRVLSMVNTEDLQVRHLRRAARAHIFEDNLHKSIEAQLAHLRVCRHIVERHAGERVSAV